MRLKIEAVILIASRAIGVIAGVINSNSEGSLNGSSININGCVIRRSSFIS